MDQEGKQRSACAFMQMHLKMCVLYVPPLCHWKVNDVELVLTKCGLRAVWHRRLVIANIAYGPWRGSLYMRDIEDIASEIRQLLHKDYLVLMLFWKRICEDRGWSSDEDTNAAARQRWLDFLETERPFTIKGPKASHARWFSVQHAVKCWDEYDTTKFMALVVLAMRQRWIVSYEDVFRRPSAAQASPSTVPDGEALPASSSSASMAQQKEQGRQSVAKANAASVNTLHAVMRMMGDESDKELVRLILLTTAPTTAQHSHDASSIRGAESTIEYFSQNAAWGFMTEIRGILAVLSDLSGLSRCGMRSEFSQAARARLKADNPEVIANDGSAQLCWDLVTHLVAQRGSSMCWHACSYPGLWAGWLLPGVDGQGFLELFRQDWEISGRPRPSSSRLSKMS